jgi:shikimate dehydrogenase
MNSSNKSRTQEEAAAPKPEPGTDKDEAQQPQSRHEVGGPPGLEPTRYGDWEKGGRCIDF